MLTISSMLSFASVIVTTNGERIENVSIQNETNSAIVYLLDGIEKSIAIEQVFAILYDDGQYKELNQLMDEMLSKHNEYVRKYGQDIPEVRNWTWHPAK